MHPGLFPSSFSQHAFWLQDQIEPGTPAFNLVRAFKIIGKVDLDLLSRSLDAVVRRNRVMRTSFVEVNGEVMQRVDENVSLRIETQDLSDRDEPESGSLEVAAELGKTSFDLTRSPIMRVNLLRTGPEHHVLVLVIHHIIIDGWSMALLFDEIAETYEALSEGREPRSSGSSVEYTDYAAWQREYLAGEAVKVDTQYWQAKLQGMPPLLELPTDHPRPAAQSHRGSRIFFEIDENILDRLKSLCSRKGATLFMGLLATFQVLLHRYADTDDIPVGTPVAGRNDPALSDIIGCFINTLVMRGDLSGNPSFEELISRTRSAAIGAFEHQDLPFEYLVAELHPRRTFTHAPVFQVMFVLQNANEQIPRLPGLDVEELEFDPGLSKVDLTLEVIEQKGLYCSLEYSTDLFEHSTIQMMAQHFQELLGGAVNSPELAISELALMSQADRKRMLFDWNATFTNYPRDLTLARGFENQVELTPEATALIAGSQRITYRDLNSRANQVGHVLHKLGARCDEPIGIFLPRTIETVVAMLGVLKAGASYLPLETSQPRKRLDLIIESTRCRFVLTSRSLAPELPGSVMPILLDSDAALWTSEPGHAPPQVESGELAYVIFTSGSTGVPKGVMGTHRATINRFEWMYRTYPFVAGEVCCQKTAIGFVDSVWEIFGPLLRGIPNVIFTASDVLDIPEFFELLSTNNVSRIVLVPTLLRVMLDYAPDLESRLPHLKLWSVSGEYLPVDLARRFCEACPSSTLLNIYGSSEVAADVTYHSVSANNQKGAVPIGKPIDNAQVYVLGRHREPVPIGVPGVIHVGGDCLSPGYFGRPDLTQERFILNPIAGAPSERLFITGDRGRFLSGGEIEYLGRADFQVKIRGMRVELEEIEKVLLEHPRIEDAVTVVVGTTPETQRIVAFVAGLGGPAPSSDELRRFTRERLPDYMVPSSFEEIASVPLLPSGKADRRALQQLATEDTGHSRRSVAPPTEIEQKLVKIWQELLQVSDVTVLDNFFELGGNSLLAVRMIARVCTEFSVNVSIRSLFDNPTLAAFGEEVQTAKRSGAPPRPEIKRQQPAGQLETLATELAKLSPEQVELLLKSVAATKKAE